MKNIRSINLLKHNSIKRPCCSIGVTISLEVQIYHSQDLDDRQSVCSGDELRKKHFCIITKVVFNEVHNAPLHFQEKKKIVALISQQPHGGGESTRK